MRWSAAAVCEKKGQRRSKKEGKVFTAHERKIEEAKVKGKIW